MLKENVRPSNDKHVENETVVKVTIKEIVSSSSPDRQTDVSAEQNCDILTSDILNEAAANETQVNDTSDSLASAKRASIEEEVVSGESFATVNTAPTILASASPSVVAPTVCEDVAETDVSPAIVVSAPEETDIVPAVIVSAQEETDVSSETVVPALDNTDSTSCEVLPVAVEETCIAEESTVRQLVHELL